MLNRSLILKRAPIGPNHEDYSVLEDGVVVGRIFRSTGAPPDRQWMWASGHSARTVARAAHGYEPTREAAMAALRSRGGGSDREQRSSCDDGRTIPGDPRPAGDRGHPARLDYRHPARACVAVYMIYLVGGGAGGIATAVLRYRPSKTLR